MTKVSLSAFKKMQKASAAARGDDLVQEPASGPAESIPVIAHVLGAVAEEAHAANDHVEEPPDGSQLSQQQAVRLFQQTKRAAAQMSDLRANGLELAPLDCHSRNEYVREIQTLWSSAKDRFLAIGRYLLTAKALLPHGEYEAMISEDLPFTPSVARMLVGVARAVDQSPPLCRPEQLPTSYSVAYQIVTLRPEEFEVAQKEGLIRPDVRRSDLIKFKERVRTHRHQDQTTRSSSDLSPDRAPASGLKPDDTDMTFDELQSERQTLLARLQRIDELLARYDGSPLPTARSGDIDLLD
jgi:hypothetical protein